MPKKSLNDWVEAQFSDMRKNSCNQKGEVITFINIDPLRSRLYKERSQVKKEIKVILNRLDYELCQEICRPLKFDENGVFPNKQIVVDHLRCFRRELDTGAAYAIVKKIEDENVAVIRKKKKSSGPTGMLSTRPPTKENVAIESWVQQQYLVIGFNDQGFVGWKEFTDRLISLRPTIKERIPTTIQRLRQPGSIHSLKDPELVVKSRAADRKKTRAKPRQTTPSSCNNASTLKGQNMGGFQTPNITSAPMQNPTQTREYKEPAQSVENRHVRKDNILSRKMMQLEISKQSHEAPRENDISDDGLKVPDDELLKESIILAEGTKYDPTDFLLADNHATSTLDPDNKRTESQIQHAPLVSGEVLASAENMLLPQYGLLGSLDTEAIATPESKIFLNTNVPFSTFICGVQGSGKSHTASCIMENALLPTRYLGRLENPVSTLVFSWGEFSADGSGFIISEAAFLAAANNALPGNSCVKNVTVLISPSNPAIKKLYQRFPNTKVMPFKLKAKSLDISAMLTLMAVDESSAVPLYLAKVENILRQLATENENGGFDYLVFKERLSLCEFNPTQLAMLELRLGLLESFLDMEGNCPEPEFRPGEVTIMDLSCPFVSPNTACILFKLGLQRFLQSNAPGKMVVLDEAHKYMLKVSGAKVLNDYLITVIRLQRHFGARVVISTQEPTLLTDLIALCSVTIIHRFSSPHWFNAIKKHIPLSDKDQNSLVQEIETLAAGVALVYSPNAVLGQDANGTLRKGVGRMLKLNIRKRVTSDGGQSIMCV